MENKEQKNNTPVELEDDALDKVAGGGELNEQLPTIPTYEPILFKK